MIFVDLDKTLAESFYGDRDQYGFYYIGKPIPKMIKKVKKWLATGKTVKVFTARLSDPKIDKKQMEEAIKFWTNENIGVPLESTNIKEINVEKFYDDKARRIEINTGKRIK